eukprot:3239580-Pyramimonas_sp.AAC.1
MGGRTERYEHTSVARQLCTGVPRMWRHFPSRPRTQKASFGHCLWKSTASRDSRVALLGFHGSHGVRSSGSHVSRG